MKLWILAFSLILSVSAQEEVSFEKFKTDYETMKKDIGLAKERAVPVDPAWITAHAQGLQKLIGVSQGFLLGDASQEVKQAVLNLDLDPLVKDLRFVVQRSEVEDGVKNWPLKKANEKIFSAKQLSDQLDTNGLQFEYQPQQISMNLFWIEIVTQVLDSPDFWTRVCDGAGEECLKGSGLVKDETSVILKKISEWSEKAKNWQKPKE